MQLRILTAEKVDLSGVRISESKTRYIHNADTGILASRSKKWPHPARSPNRPRMSSLRRRVGNELAPCTRGDGPRWYLTPVQPKPCSPRTRGWTPRNSLRSPTIYLLPAHAGMALGGWPQGAAPRNTPRARGDGPEWSTREAPPDLPRARGDERPRLFRDGAVFH